MGRPTLVDGSPPPAFIAGRMILAALLILFPATAQSPGWGWDAQAPRGLIAEAEAAPGAAPGEPDALGLADIAPAAGGQRTSLAAAASDNSSADGGEPAPAGTLLAPHQLGPTLIAAL